VIDEHHIDDHQTNLLIDTIYSKEEEASDNEKGGENQPMPQEELINYALTVEVEDTTAHGLVLHAMEMVL
jgi:hypothetical protein